MKLHRLTLLNVCVVLSIRLGWTAKRQLYIGGFFPLTGTPVASSGRALLPACEMALEMINNRSDILPGYELNMIWSDTRCEVGNSIKILYEYLARSIPVIMLLGAACSSVTKVVAEAAWHWNLLQVSYASTASSLSSKSKYPLLYRAMSPDSAYNTARVRFLQHYHWDRVATLWQNDFVFTEVMTELHQSLSKHNFTLVASESFSNDPTSQLRNLKEKDARIIVGMFYEDKARRVFCEAYKLGIYGAKYVWLLLDWADDHEWWLTNDSPDVTCTAEQMSRAVSGYFSIDSANLQEDDKPGISGMSSREFMRVFSASYGNRTNLYVPFAFDSVWVIALALHNAAERLQKQNKTLDVFTYTDKAMAGVLKESMESLAFQGVTGNIKFSNKGERKLPVRVKQLQGGRPITIAVYSPVTDRITQNATVPVLWQGAGPPLDSQRTTYKVVYVASPLLWVTIVLASGGILLALGFLCFNFRYRHHSYIKLSSPNLNNVIILGALFLYLSIYLVALDGRTVDPASLPRICTATSYLLGTGYSLAVGAMFSKTWRVHQIFNKVKPKKKVFRDSELIGLVVLLVLVDLTVLSLWAGVDPLKYGLHEIGDEISRTDDVILIPQYEYCYSKHTTTWLYIIMGYKGLILLVGCFISWETRKVKVRALNDSRFVGMSVYNIVLAVVIGGPLTFLVGDHGNAFVALYSFFVFFPTSISLCLLFVPKIIKIRKHPEEFLRLQSLSAMRMSSEYGSSYSSSSTDHVTVVRLQAELAQVKRELEEQKTATRASQQHREPRPDDDHTDLDLSTIGKLPYKRSQTCIDFSELEHFSPVGSPQRRSNTFSCPVHTAALDGSYLGEGLNTISDLKAENAGLRRELQESKIIEAGKMCKVLYKNAELDRKLVELSMKQRAGSTEEDDAVARLMRENTELKRQLGEVGILNSVWCDVTPRLRRKARRDSKERDDLKELNKLLTVDLGGTGRSSSFGPSRHSRPPPIGKSQSSLDLLDSKDWGPEEEKDRSRVNSDGTGITIVVDSDNMQLIDGQENYHMKHGIAQKEAAELQAGPEKMLATRTLENSIRREKQSTKPMNFSDRTLSSHKDNKGFVLDEFNGKANEVQREAIKSTKGDKEKDKRGLVAIGKEKRQQEDDKGHIRHNSDDFDETLCERTVLATQRLRDNSRQTSTAKKYPETNNITRSNTEYANKHVTSSKNLPPPIRREIGSEASDYGMDSAPVSMQYPHVPGESRDNADEPTRSRRRQKSEKHIEKVEKTFFV